MHISKFVDSTELCGAVDTWRRRTASQRDLGRLEQSASVIPMKFNRAKYKVLHLGLDIPVSVETGNEWIESSSAEKDFGIMVDEKIGHQMSVWACSPESKSKSGLHKTKHVHHY